MAVLMSTDPASRGQSPLPLWAAVVLVVVAILAVVIAATKPVPPYREAPADRETVSLLEGNGRDWLSASTAAKMQCCETIVQVTKKHSAIAYYGFLEALYTSAERDDNRYALEMDVSEAAAVAAVTNLRE